MKFYILRFIEKSLYYSALSLVGFSCAILVSTWPAQAATCKGETDLGDFGTQSEAQKLASVQEWAELAYVSTDLETELCALIAVFKDAQQPVEVRRNAMNVSGSIGTGAETAIPYLVEILETDPSLDLRRSALINIRRVGADPVVDVLIRALDQPDPEVRSLAARALESVGYPAAKAAIPKLENLLHNDLNSDVRVSAVRALSLLVESDKDLANIVETALDDSSWYVRDVGAWSVALVKDTSQISVSKLQKSLEDGNHTLRTSAARALGHLGNDATEAIPDLNAALSDPNFYVRGAAALSLGQIRAYEKETVEALIELLEDPVPHVRWSAMKALRTLSFDLSKRLSSGELTLQEAIDYYSQALEHVENPALGFPQQDIDDVSNRLVLLQASRYRHVVLESIRSNKLVWVLLLYGFAHLCIFWLRPLWLLKIDRVIAPLSLEIPVLGTRISARFLLFSRYYPRVLDAWVKAYLPVAKENFYQKTTVSSRHIHVPTAVVLNGRTVSDLTGQDLQKRFKKHLLITGEGGSGKTSLACQIAKWAMSDDVQQRIASHPMLPVLIESPLEKPGEGKDPLVEAIQGQLEDLTNASSPVSEELLIELLKQRRLLIIVDHLSEMNETTREQIRPDLPTFFVNALIVTSRDEHLIDRVTRTTLKPIRIEGNHIASFMEAYLTRLNKRDLFTDVEFFVACSRLSKMVGTRNITPLLAKLYAEELVSAKIDAARETVPELPDNIPDLMLLYINELNRFIHDDKLDDRTLHKDAERIAWECVKANYSPAPAKRDAVLEALGGKDAPHRLDYLEHCLHLIQTISPAEDQIQFALDPLAEYLAGLYLVQQYGADQEAWHRLIDDLHQVADTPGTIAGFLIAVRDCCLAKKEEANIPSFVSSELAAFEVSA